VMSCPPAQCDDQDFVIHLLPCPVLLAAVAIPRHEDVQLQLVSYTAKELKANGVGKRSIFSSHRWVNGKPDSDDNAQLQYIQNTIRLFDNHEFMFVWIDYSCMKQNAPDIPTIRRLNFILSYCEFFMVILPASDPLGLEYVRRVWCIYEWLSVLHYKKVLILPTPDFASQFLTLTLKMLEELVCPGVFDLMEAIRVQVGSRIDVLSDCLQSVCLEDPIFNRTDFVSKLQAFVDVDKEYVYTNLSECFTMLDLLFVYIAGGGTFKLQTISVLGTPEGSLFCSHLNNNIRSISSGKIAGYPGSSSSSPSSLGWLSDDSD
jgi:hypothetical protein